ncbi:MAG TPA: MarR family transcriptional regulator [Bacteroidales bacterium]|nr:MarR family transcriptional regulator [Bacteroidales bacterium]
MKGELQDLIDQFLKILHLYAVINRKPKDYGTGDLLYLTEIHTLTMVARNRRINMTRLAEMMGVTRGAISQTIRKMVIKGLIVKENSTNRKEFNLSLSPKGEKVMKAQESLQKEIFSFAATLYEKAGTKDREMVARLFTAISGNMEERVKAL